MARKRYTTEQIIRLLREAEVRLGQEQTVGTICRALSITEQTCYRWLRECGGLKLDQVKRLKDLERELFARGAEIEKLKRELGRLDRPGCQEERIQRPTPDPTPESREPQGALVPRRKRATVRSSDTIKGMLGRVG